MVYRQSEVHHCDIAIVGAGIVGICIAYYLKMLEPKASVLLLDSNPPMSFTSAQSGENYRNWWPHPVMTAFTDHSIDLMEVLARKTDNCFHMNRRGYILATRAKETDSLMNELISGYSELSGNAIRVHDGPSSATYAKPDSPAWEKAPSGVDVLRHPDLISKTFPSYDQAISTVVHIRRAGDISAQQMGQFMFQQYRDAGGMFVQGSVSAIETSNSFALHCKENSVQVQAEQLINAAGPYLNHIAGLLGESLNIRNVLQQKIAFEDTAKVVPRDMPFSIDLDPQRIDWTDEEAELLAESESHQWLLRQMPGSIHCRPDGGDGGNRVKLGWAFNESGSNVSREPRLQDEFPEIVLRGAARLNPALRTYYDKLPGNLYHYGGYYTLTEENWPLIGAMKTPGAYVVGAMSGFGTMAACAAGDLAARWVLDKTMPEFAAALSPLRYTNVALMEEIGALNQRGIL